MARSGGNLFLGTAASVFALAWWACPPASAQQTPQAAAAASSDDDEIIVTAQKREQNVLDVGISVSALSQSDLNEQRIQELSDLDATLPNVAVKNQIPGAIPVISIRGVGLDDFSSTNNPAAGIYVDEVFLSSLALMSSDFYDLQRVEVLRGPQGTLYGGSSEGGTLRFIMPTPSLTT